MSQRVFVAVGYTLSSNGLIVGDDGVIVVDPGHAVPVSRNLREAFAAVSDKPVKAIIYTHGHPDHTGGAGAFITPDSDVQVWARANFNSETNALRIAGIPLNARPADSQGADLLPEKRFSFYGPVEPMRSSAGGGQNQPGVPPNRTFDTPRMSLTISGVRLELVAAPEVILESSLRAWGSPSRSNLHRNVVDLGVKAAGNAARTQAPLACR